MDLKKDDSSIDIISKGRTITIKDQKEKNILLIKEDVITLSKAQEVEIDGIFNIKNFSQQLLILKKLQFYI